ncbi:hypothetical protein MUS1_15185 [Marinomonas ushuaiensis DSM 15871]|uniref:Uncharacterized protein n=1 Tax=Marinomonas ushuaiensis DSM 15871 TaxID=1122207 RepID=X7E5H1_9GAMM|nr:hypothetical protein MUS1_15185 [Marinomonas ushuaiensis DSM 15871]
MTTQNLFERAVGYEYAFILSSAVSNDGFYIISTDQKER